MDIQALSVLGVANIFSQGVFSLWILILVQLHLFGGGEH